jgi:hypothetical protein
VARMALLPVSLTEQKLSGLKSIPLRHYHERLNAPENRLPARQRLTGDSAMNKLV